MPTLAWCRSTPYMASFLAFSRNSRSACAGLIDLKDTEVGVSETVCIISNGWLQSLNINQHPLSEITCMCGATPSPFPPVLCSVQVPGSGLLRSQCRGPLGHTLQALTGLHRSPTGTVSQRNREELHA